MLRSSRSKNRPLCHVARDPFRVRVGRVLHRFLLLQILLIFASAGFFAARYLYRFVFESDYFAVREVQIGNVSETLEREARRWIRARLEETGNNLCRLDTAQLRAELAAIPRAKRVEVSRTLPNTLIVQFVERRPVIVANLNGPCLVDEDGVVIGAIKPQAIRNLNLPLLTGIRNQACPPGDPIDQAGLDGVLQTAGFLLRTDPKLHRQIVEWNLNNRDEVTATLSSGAEVRFGNLHPLTQMRKLSAALQLRDELKEASTIDLRMRDQVVYTLKGGESS